MKYLRFAVLFFSLLGLHAAAEVVSFYIGTLTDASSSQGIYLGSLDTVSGNLGPLRLAAPAKNPNFLALSRDRRFLFAAQTDTVGSFQVRTDGSLAPLNGQPSGGAGPCFVSLDQAGRHVFVANYDGGNITAFPVDPQGIIGTRTARIQFTGSGPNPGRQTKPYAHSVSIDPENKYVYSCDLGSDSIWIFRFHSGSGTLVPVLPPAAKVPPGSGPRHIAFHGKFVYVVNEMGVSVTVFTRAAAGALTALETVSALPPGTSTQGVTAAEICCHPSGKWLYVSNRGSDTLSVFAIASDGRLSLLQNIPSIVKFPRSFALDPTGQWLLAAGQKDNCIALFKIDLTTGRLTPTDQTAAVPVPVCVLFAAKK